NMSPANYFVYREQGTAFQDVGMYQGDSVSVVGAGEPEQVRALDISEGVLPILGVPPFLGRGFTKDACVTDNPAVLILSSKHCQRKFGGDESVTGPNTTVDGKPFQVVGVLPKSFISLDQEDRNIFLPLKLDRAKVRLGQYSYEGLARLKPGMTVAQGNAD